MTLARSEMNLIDDDIYMNVCIGKWTDSIMLEAMLWLK
jgi:hypothetical protein